MVKKGYKFKKTLAYDNRAMAKIKSHIDTNQRLLVLVRSVLPENLAPHAISCLIKNDRLLVYATSATWATKLRFHGRSLLLGVNKLDRLQIKKVVVRISQALVMRANKQQRLPNRPALASISAIQYSAQATDGALQKALLRLSKTLRVKASAINNPPKLRVT